MHDKQRGLRAIACDPHYLVALFLGPVVWLLLYLWLEPVTGSHALQTLLLVCLIYPLLEEFAFRGFLQSWLIEKQFFAKQQLLNISNANLATSVVFAASHLVNQPPLWAGLVFFPSLVFGYFRDRYELVWPCVILHCWYNSGFFLLLN